MQNILGACERAVQEAEFAAAIISEDIKNLRNIMDPRIMYGNNSGYEGPEPSGNSFNDHLDD